MTGHQVGLRTISFPHICPGDGCAVERWLTEREARRWFEGLREITEGGLMRKKLDPTKSRNEATVRNVRASQKRDDALLARVKALEESASKLDQRVGRLEFP